MLVLARTFVNVLYAKENLSTVLSSFAALKFWADKPLLSATADS